MQGQNAVWHRHLTGIGAGNLLPQANEKPVITDLVCELVLLFLFFQRKERQGKMNLGIAICKRCCNDGIIFLNAAMQR